MHALPRGLAAALTALALLLTACGGADDGATVREIGTEDGSSSGSGSGSASGSGSSSASAPASGSGSASGSGPASASSTATEGAAVEAQPDQEGGYAYATDVSAHRLVTRDVCTIKDLLDVEPLDAEAIEAVYVDGGASVNPDGSVRTLQGFATAEDRLHGLEDGVLDDAMAQALQATGPVEGAEDAVRAQLIEKTAQNRIMVAWTVHELNAALAKAEEGDLDPEEGAVHNWDEAWAFYHGAEPGCAPHGTADSRAENFGTAGEDGTAATNAAILEAMSTGRDALLAEDVDGARAAADEVIRNVVITYSQAAIRYATLAEEDVAADDLATAREHQAEGHAFFQVIAPIVADAGADVDAVQSILGLDAEPGTAGGDAVREALQPAWDALGITAADIGELQ